MVGDYEIPGVLLEDDTIHLFMPVSGIGTSNNQICGNRTDLTMAVTFGRPRIVKENDDNGVYLILFSRYTPEKESAAVKLLRPEGCRVPVAQKNEVIVYLRFFFHDNDDRPYDVTIVKAKEGDAFWLLDDKGWMFYCVNDGRILEVDLQDVDLFYEMLGIQMGFDFRCWYDEDKSSFPDDLFNPDEWRYLVEPRPVLLT